MFSESCLIKTRILIELDVKSVVNHGGRKLVKLWREQIQLYLSDFTDLPFLYMIVTIFSREDHRVLLGDEKITFMIQFLSILRRFFRELLLWFLHWSTVNYDAQFFHLKLGDVLVYFIDLCRHIQKHIQIIVKKYVSNRATRPDTIPCPEKKKVTEPASSDQVLPIKFLMWCRVRLAPFRFKKYFKSHLKYVSDLVSLRFVASRSLPSRSVPSLTKIHVFSLFPQFYTFSALPGSHWFRSIFFRNDVSFLCENGPIWTISEGQHIVFDTRSFLRLSIGSYLSSFSSFSAVRSVCAHFWRSSDLSPIFSELLWTSMGLALCWTPSRTDLLQPVPAPSHLGDTFPWAPARTIPFV